MATSKRSTSKASQKKSETNRAKRSVQKRTAPLKALPQPESGPNPECGVPGGGRGRVDIVGRRPKGIGIDPNFMEGHPGYEESGSSELSPPPRPGKKKAASRHR